MRKFFKLCGVALLGITMLSSCTEDYLGDSRNIAESFNQSDLNGTWQAVSIEGVIDLYVYDYARTMQDYNLNLSFTNEGWRNEVEKTIYYDYFVRLRFEGTKSTMSFHNMGRWYAEESETFKFISSNRINMLNTTYEIRELTHDRLVLYLSGGMASEYAQDLTKDYHYMILTYKRVA